MEWHPGWKLLRERRSAIVPAPLGVRYPRRVVVTPHPDCGPLCVFADPARAAVFLVDLLQEVGRIPLKLQLVPCAYLPAAVRAVWTLQARAIIPVEDLPPGTALADAVVCWE